MNRNIYRSGTYYKSQLFNLMFTYLFSFKRIRNGLILAYLHFLLCSSTNSERLIVVLLCSLSTILYILKQNNKKKAVLIRLKNFSELTFDNFFFLFHRLLFYDTCFGFYLFNVPNIYYSTKHLCILYDLLLH